MNNKESSTQNEINLIGVIVDIIATEQNADKIRPGALDSILDELTIKLQHLQREQAQA